jgi:hypothetical protein
MAKTRLVLLGLILGCAAAAANAQDRTIHLRATVATVNDPLGCWAVRSIPVTS